MNPLGFGTGGSILNRANSAVNIARSGSITTPGYDRGRFVTQNGLRGVEPIYRYLQSNWALPIGSPADFPMLAGIRRWRCPNRRSCNKILENRGGGRDFGAVRSQI